MATKKSKPALVTCGIYLFCTQNRKILICHATHASWKTWSIPKGLRDADEDSYPAAIRELKEETGIEASDLKILQVHTFDPVSYKKVSKELHSFLLITSTDLSHFLFHCQTLIKNTFPEIDSWKWVDPAEAKSLLHESQLVHLPEVFDISSKYLP